MALLSLTIEYKSVLETIAKSQHNEIKYDSEIEYLPYKQRIFEILYLSS